MGADAVGIERWLALGRDRFPDVSIGAEILARHLDRLGIDPASEQPHAADLVLACACGEAVPAALAAFERDLMPVARAAARRIDPSSDFTDEVAQTTRDRLLVAAAGARPRIAEYAGRGSLAAWVRVAAMRNAMNLLRDRRRNVLVDDEAFFEAVAHVTGPERQSLTTRYAGVCAESLRTAFTRLSARERNLLRMHHLHGLTVDELAPTYRVHRATVARWLTRAREQLLSTTREELRARLAVNDSTADSILRQLSGRIDVTVSRLLAE